MAKADQLSASRLLVHDLDLLVDHLPGKAIDRHACHAIAPWLAVVLYEGGLAKAGAPSNVARLQLRIVRGKTHAIPKFAIPSFVDSFVRMSVEDLESAVSHLSAAELARFRQWFEEFAADQWDREIETDIVSGRFDAAGKQADQDFEAGHCTPL